MKKIRTRFAPSPTGPLHIGGVRTALYCYLFAKKNKGDFLLRIEDTDQGRYVAGAEQYVIDSLKWLGISPNEGQGVGGDFGPYRQSDRKHLYKKYAEILIEKGHAYYAFDSSDELTKWREENPNKTYGNTTRLEMNNSLTISKETLEKRLEDGVEYVVRYKMPKNEEINFTDLIRENVSFNTNELDDKVLFKSDGMPTYHLANIVDDHLMEITHVIRGEEWLPSTPLHVKLYESFGWEMPAFAHLPLILKPSPSSYITKNTRNNFVEIFTKSFIQEHEDYINDFEKVKAFIAQLFQNVKILQERLVHRKKDSNLQKDVKLFLKKSLFGKLSKRDGARIGFPVFPLEWKDPKTKDISQGFKETGFLPEAFINMLAFLGWNPGSDQEIFSKQELIEAFSLERVNKAGAKFDFKKTQWFNQQYLKAKTEEELLFLTKPIFEAKGYKKDDKFLISVCNLLKERVVYSKEIPEVGYYFFEDIKQYDEQNLRKKWQTENAEKFDILLSELNALENFSADNLEALVESFLEKNQLSLGQVLPVLRISITGSMQGPSIFEVMSLLGKEISNTRLTKGIELAKSL